MTFEKQNNPLEAQKQREGTPKKEEVQAKIDTLQQKESTSPDEVRTIAVDIAQM